MTEKKKPAPKKSKKAKRKGGEEIGSTEMLNRVRALKTQVRAQKSEYALAKAHASELKKEFESSVEKLLKLIELSEQGAPLFDGIKNDDKGEANLEADDSWKEVKLAEVFVALPSGLRQKVEDASLVTLHELTEFCKSQALTDIPGVGQANADKLDQALQEFWQRRKEAAESAFAGIPKATAAPLDEAAK
jgi:hypothetical protein